MASDVCKHCTHAACLDVCPTGALFRTEFGTVVVQDDVCNGCGYCVAGLPLRGHRAPQRRRGPRADRQSHGISIKGAEGTGDTARVRTRTHRPTPRPTVRSRTSASPRSARSATTASAPGRPPRARRPAPRRRSSSATSTTCVPRRGTGSPTLHDARLQRGAALRRRRERRRRWHRLGRSCCSTSRRSTACRRTRGSPRPTCPTCSARPATRG